MSRNIDFPSFAQADEKTVAEKIKLLGEGCRFVKKNFPETWRLVANQYQLECLPKVLSEEVFNRLLEATLAADDDLNKRKR